MRIETTTDAQGKSSQHFIAEAGEHLIYTGKATGIKTLADGSAIDVSPDFVVVANEPDAISEVHDLLGRHWVENGHPDDVDTLTDPETGAVVPVQRPFVYETEATGELLVGVGVPHGEHPLDAANDIVAAMADPRIADSKKG